MAFADYEKRFDSQSKRGHKVEYAFYLKIESFHSRGQHV